MSTIETFFAVNKDHEEFVNKYNFLQVDKEAKFPKIKRNESIKKYEKINSENYDILYFFLMGGKKLQIKNDDAYYEVFRKTEFHSTEEAILISTYCTAANNMLETFYNLTKKLEQTLDDSSTGDIQDKHYVHTESTNGTIEFRKCRVNEFFQKTFDDTKCMVVVYDREYFTKSSSATETETETPDNEISLEQLSAAKTITYLYNNRELSKNLKLNDIGMNTDAHTPLFYSSYSSVINESVQKCLRKTMDYSSYKEYIKEEGLNQFEKVFSKVANFMDTYMRVQIDTKTMKATHNNDINILLVIKNSFQQQTLPRSSPNASVVQRELPIHTFFDEMKSKPDITGIMILEIADKTEYNISFKYEQYNNNYVVHLLIPSKLWLTVAMKIASLQNTFNHCLIYIPSPEDGELGAIRTKREFLDLCRAMLFDENDKVDLDTFWLYGTELTFEPVYKNLFDEVSGDLQKLNDQKQKTLVEPTLIRNGLNHYSYWQFGFHTEERKGGRRNPVHRSIRRTTGGIRQPKFRTNRKQIMGGMTGLFLQALSLSPVPQVISSFSPFLSSCLQNPIFIAIASAIATPMVSSLVHTVIQYANRNTKNSIPVLNREGSIFQQSDGPKMYNRYIQEAIHIYFFPFLKQNDQDHLFELFVRVDYYVNHDLKGNYPRGQDFENGENFVMFRYSYLQSIAPNQRAAEAVQFYQHLEIKCAGYTYRDISQSITTWKPSPISFLLYYGFFDKIYADMCSCRQKCPLYRAEFIKCTITSKAIDPEKTVTIIRHKELLDYYIYVAYAVHQQMDILQVKKKTIADLQWFFEHFCNDIPESDEQHLKTELHNQIIVTSYKKLLSNLQKQTYLRDRLVTDKNIQFKVQFSCPLYYKAFGKQQPIDSLAIKSEADSQSMFIFVPNVLRIRFSKFWQIINSYIKTTALKWQVNNEPVPITSLIVSFVASDVKNTTIAKDDYFFAFDPIYTQQLSSHEEGGVTNWFRSIHLFHDCLYSLYIIIDETLFAHINELPVEWFCNNDMRVFQIRLAARLFSSSTRYNKTQTAHDFAASTFEGIVNRTITAIRQLVDKLQFVSAEELKSTLFARLLFGYFIDDDPQFHHLNYEKIVIEFSNQIKSIPGSAVVQETQVNDDDTIFKSTLGVHQTLLFALANTATPPISSVFSSLPPPPQPSKPPSKSSRAKSTRLKTITTTVSPDEYKNLVDNLDQNILQRYFEDDVNNLRPFFNYFTFKTVSWLEQHTEGKSLLLQEFNNLPNKDLLLIDLLLNIDNSNIKNFLQRLPMSTYSNLFSKAPGKLNLSNINDVVSIFNKSQSLFIENSNALNGLLKANDDKNISDTLNQDINDTILFNRDGKLQYKLSNQLLGDKKGWLYGALCENSILTILANKKIIQQYTFFTT